jgi:RNA polymerase sigma factor (sigma-70 family)
MEPQESKINATTVLEHLDWVRGLALSLVRDASRADDIMQEAWLAALRRPAAAGVASKGWLARVVRNAVRQENRRTAIRSEHEERARLRDETASTDELVDRVHTQRMVVDAVLALDTPYQKVILLRYFEGLAPRDIARRQGTPGSFARHASACSSSPSAS